MDLRKLEIFAYVAQLQSFSKAAQQLHMAQPAVSIAVRKLEEELNHQLLERHKRSIRLTSQGEIALKKALEILQQVGELKDSILHVGHLLFSAIIRQLFGPAPRINRLYYSVGHP